MTVSTWPTVLSAALLSALALQATAQTCDTCETRATTPDALTVVRDRETGELRAPTAAEQSTLGSAGKPAPAAAAAASTARAQAALPSAVRAYASGARSARLPSDLGSYSVVTRQQDGTLDRHCVESQQSADALLREASAATARPARKETE